jgi:hypothetical protein
MTSRDDLTIAWQNARRTAGIERARGVLNKLGVSSLDDIPADKMDEACALLDSIAQAAGDGEPLPFARTLNPTDIYTRWNGAKKRRPATESGT